MAGTRTLGLGEVDWDADVDVDQHEANRRSKRYASPVGAAMEFFGVLSRGFASMLNGHREITLALTL